MSSFGNKDIMAENIKYFLALRGVSATDVCLALNIPKSTFSNWCTGKTYPRIDKIEALSKFFDCQKADLVEKRKPGMADVIKIELDRKRAQLINLYNSLSTEEQQMALKLLMVMAAQRMEDDENGKG